MSEPKQQKLAKLDKSDQAVTASFHYILINFSLYQKKSVPLIPSPSYCIL